MKQNVKLGALFLLATFVSLFAAGCTSPASPGEDTDAVYTAIMAKAGDISKELDTAQKAWDLGYRPDASCIPGMGNHWIHKPGQEDSYFDTTIDASKPEVLLFVPDADAPFDVMKQKFVGIEYAAVTQGLPTNTTATVPAVLGKALDGPMAGHSPEMPWHAELHVFLAPGSTSTKDFAGTLPGIVCPTGTTPPEVEAHATIMAKANEVAADLNTAQKAWDAGYRPDAFCIPGMGNHWIHKPGQEDSYLDAELDADHPEVLLFEPDAADPTDPMKHRFVGIEYVVVTQGLPTNTTATVPKLFGHPLDGPMAGHTPEMPWHVEVHVYLGDGMESTPLFLSSSSGVKCPESTLPPSGE